MSVIGLDVGTSRVKAVRLDADWRAADSESEPTKVTALPDGGREQQLDEVWSAVADVVAAVVSRSPDPIELVAVTAQGDGCWLVDADARPVAPALLWNDSRAAGVIDTWQADGTLAEAFGVSGCYGAPGVAHAQLRWLVEHSPEVVERAHALLSCGSWIYANLTGRLVLEETEAANPFFAAVDRAYAPALLETFGLSSLARLLPPAVRGADRLAPLTSSAASRLGLASGVPVALAPYDVPATAIGTGVVRPGGSFAVLGTTLCVGTVHDSPLLDREPNGMTLPGVTDDRWLIAYATMSGTEVLDWTAALLGLPDAAAVVRLAASSTHGSPPLVLPYLSPAGERSPFLDPSARGTITGLDFSHRPADVARAALDGLTLAVLDCLTAAGLPRSLALSGGGSRSELWRQSIADAVGVPVVRPDVDEVGARGAVLVAAADAGMFTDLDTAVDAVIGPGTTHEPDARRAEFWRDRYARFTGSRDALRSGRHPTDAGPVHR